MRRIVTRTGTATALCLAVSVQAATAQPVPTAAPGGDDKNSLRTARREVDALFADAGRTTQRYEAAKKAVGRQQRRIERLGRQVRDQQRKVTELRARLGRIAAMQYRSGGDASLTPTAQFMLSSNPAEFLDRVYLADKGEHAAGLLMHQTQRAQDRLEAEQARAAQAKLELDHELYLQGRAKKALEAKLVRAQAQLEKLQESQHRVRGAGCTEFRSAVPFAMNGGEDTADGKPFVARKWRVPVNKYEITSRFGQTGEHWGSLHSGLDFAVPEGRPVRSVGFGTVYELGCDGAFGNSVTIRHDDGYFTFYAHLSRIEAYPGERVFPGQHIGLAGTTGNSTGPHLHFEVRATPEFGSGIDPEPWLRTRGIRP
ncbi:hypothetical protein SRB5_14800 [Streptomyces sp. RB5]|uniref:M23ase beta-sheet core domain-containing protein n=1 Tax=Streptomyces smaragdinus TaxID=2585196 RepID=A0A7K0CF20_9ACTN|nr:M23 family metallopeptidase [Streptomyces smaragdinus]MQY11364.1 hypothetical protein [Streptomyces smaragdinus]